MGVGLLIGGVDLHCYVSADRRENRVTGVDDVCVGERGSKSLPQLVSVCR